MDLPPLFSKQRDPDEKKVFPLFVIDIYGVYWPGRRGKDVKGHLERQDVQKNLWVWGLSFLGLEGVEKDPDGQKQNKQENMKLGEFLEKTHKEE